MRILFEFEDDFLFPANEDGRFTWGYLVKYRAGFKCSDCDTDEKRLDAHHIDGDNKNNRLSNGSCLCISCHARRRWEEDPGFVAKMRAGAAASHVGSLISQGVKAAWEKRENRSAAAYKAWETRRGMECESS